MKWIIYCWPLINLFVACSQGPGQKVQSSAPYREQVLQLVEKIKFPQAVELAQGGDTRLKITPGQWVSFVTWAKDGSDNLVLTTIKVLAMQGNEVTIETESYSAQDGIKNVVQKVIANFPLQNEVLFTNVKFDEKLSDMKIVRAFVQIGDGPAQELSINDLQSSGFHKALFSGIGQQGDVRAEISCKTPYLVSNFCKEFNYSVQLNDKKTQGITWGHGLVPIVGHLKIESDQQKTEVIAFGLTGAVSSLRR